MNVLGIAQEFCRRTGLPIPTFFAGNPDQQVTQIKGLMNEALDELADRGIWEKVEHEAVWTVTDADEDQGTIISRTDPGYQYMQAGSFFCRTTALQMRGPLNDVDWQSVKAVVGPLVLYAFRFKLGHIFITPAPKVGDVYAFEYISRYLLIGGSGPIRWVVADADEFLLDEGLLILCMRWMWKKEKGLAYAEDFERYESMLFNQLNRDKPFKKLRLDSYPTAPGPGIFVSPAAVNVSNLP